MVLAFFIIMAGGVYFAFAAAVLAVIGWYEFVRAFSQKDIKLPFFGGALSILALVLSYPLASAFSLNADIFRHVATLVTAYVLIKMVVSHDHFAPTDAFTALAGIFYLGGGFYYIVHLRLGFSMQLGGLHGLSLGCAFVWLALAGTWASDTFAYLAGSFLGKRKLCPEISPKKTIEGLAGGILGTVATVWLLGIYFGLPQLPLPLLGALIAILGTFGDLVESVIKRYTGIKDSGNLIPGHGGVLDRFDSLLFTAPLVYYFCLMYLVYLKHINAI